MNNKLVSIRPSHILLAGSILLGCQGYANQIATGADYGSAVRSCAARLIEDANKKAGKLEISVTAVELFARRKHFWEETLVGKFLARDSANNKLYGKAEFNVTEFQPEENPRTGKIIPGSKVSCELAESHSAYTLFNLRDELRAIIDNVPVEIEAPSYHYTDEFSC